MALSLSVAAGPALGSHSQGAPAPASRATGLEEGDDGPRTPDERHGAPAWESCSTAVLSKPDDSALIDWLDERRGLFIRAPAKPKRHRRMSAVEFLFGVKPNSSSSTPPSASSVTSSPPSSLSDRQAAVEHSDSDDASAASADELRAALRGTPISAELVAGALGALPGDATVTLVVDEEARARFLERYLVVGEAAGHGSEGLCVIYHGSGLQDACVPAWTRRYGAGVVVTSDADDALSHGGTVLVCAVMRGTDTSPLGGGRWVLHRQDHMLPIYALSL
eukprot:m51a1_g11801 hypothetical protein (278) ;mRNA; f:332033-333320